jgi:hypothetical protein
MTSNQHESYGKFKPYDLESKIFVLKIYTLVDHNIVYILIFFSNFFEMSKLKFFEVLKTAYM